MRLNIAQKIWFSVGVIALGYMGSTVLRQIQGAELEERLTFIGTRQFLLAQKSQEAEAAFERMMKGYSDAVIMEDAEGLKRARGESDSASGLLRSAVEAQGKDTERRLTVIEMARSIQDASSEAESVYQAMIAAQGNFTPEVQQRSHDIAVRNDKLKASLHELATRTSQELRTELETLARESRKHRILAIAVSILILIVSAVAIHLTIQRSIIHPVLRVIRGVRDAAEQAGEASREVAKAGGQIASSASQQSACAEETSASLQEILSMTQHNTERAMKADSLMTIVRHSVDNATETMGDLTSSMTQITAAGQQIAGLLKAIEDIAFHTNILALNAAVEAARAGGAGAGFAVVADEVRSLAHRSSEAARNTGTMIEQTTTSVNAGSAIVTRTSKVFAEIAANVTSGTQAVSEIRAGSEEQQLGIEQVTRAMAQIEQATQNNAATAEETAAAALHMDEQVRSTRDLISELMSVVGHQ